MPNNKLNVIRYITFFTVIFSMALTGCSRIEAPAISASLSAQTGAREYLSLNGEWIACKHKGLDFSYPPPADGWKTETIPQKWSKLIEFKHDIIRRSVSDLKKDGITSFADYENISAWYKKTFTLPTNKSDKLVYLNFKSMPFKSDIWLNGKKVGSSILGMVPVKYEVSGLLRYGATNELVIGLANQYALIDFEHETYLAPFNNTSRAGITGDIYLKFVPKIFIDDLFIKTEVAEKRIDVEATINNLSDKDIELSAQVEIVDPQTSIPLVKFSGSPFVIPAKTSIVVNLDKKWIAPILWSPDTPKLYMANVSIKSKAGTIDKLTRRFGFREFAIKGRQFYLNGTRMTMYRKSITGSLNRTYDDIYANIDDVRLSSRREAGNPYNCYRVWGNNPLVAMMGDEAGVTLSQTLAIFQIKQFPPDKSDIWLPNLLEHMQRFIKLLRNNPSIVIWNMTNETYWNSVPDNPVRKAICEKIVEQVRATDNTRPLDGDAEAGWDGLLDVISIHYPGMPGDLFLKYGNAGPVVPNDIYWLKDKGINAAWRAEFIWDKPLSIGEYWHICGPVNNWINFTGEDIFNWVKYSYSDKRGKDGRPDNPFVKTVQMLNDYYRMKGVASMTPWYVGMGMDVMPPAAVRPMDFHPNFYGGKYLTRKLSVFNDTAKSFPGAHIQYLLKVGSQMIGNGVIKTACNSGERKELTLKIKLPEVQDPVKAKLTVRLCYFAGGARHEVYHYDEDIYIMPQTSLSDISADKVLIFDSAGTAAGLKNIGLKSTTVAELSFDNLQGKKILIIAPDAEILSYKKIMKTFVNNGGRIIFLQQKQFPASLGLSAPETDLAHITSRAWKRFYTHPVLRGLDNAQFSFWMPNNIVAKYSMIKPVSSDMNAILDTTGVRGFAWMPLAEKPSGNGLLIFSQLNLLKSINKEPMSDFLLKRLITYALDYSSPSKAGLRFIGSKESTMKNLLETASIKYSEGIGGNGPILIDDPTVLDKNIKKKIVEFVKKGGNVWLRCSSPDDLKLLKGILPDKVDMSPMSDKIKSCVRISDSPFMNNISSEEFFWVSLDLEDRMDYFGNAESTAPLGKYEINFPFLSEAYPLIEPKLLTDYPLGKGHIILDTFDWSKAFDSENIKVIRIINALARNLGAETVIKEKKEWNYSFIDMAAAANMGYVDEYADDGKGGWLDMGKDDLCFFLINHTGLGGGVGAPVAVPPFPENYRFLGVPFKLTAPKKNSGKGMIALRGKTHSIKMPESVKEIKAGSKADKIWFLHSATYVPQEKGVVIAKYVFHYKDGVRAVFPVRSGIEVGDWCEPTQQDDAAVAWSGRNRPGLKVGLYLASWKNPFPEKKIKSIDIISGFSDAAFAVVGITLGKDNAKGSNHKTIAFWDFQKKGKILPPALTVIPKVQMYDNGKETENITFDEAGAHLAGKQYFGGNVEDLSLPALKTIELQSEFLITNVPQQKSYGLFQMMHYMKDGFRIHLSKNMKISVEIFLDKDKVLYLKSDAQLQLNKFYKVKIKMDGRTASLFINDKLDSMKTSALPAPCIGGEYIIGHGSGSGYFNGIIKSVILSGSVDKS